jgi:hypothetical protein
MNIATKTLLALLASSMVSSAFAEQPEEILKVKKSTFVNLVDLLVQRGVINKEEGTGLVTAAEQEAASDNKRADVSQQSTDAADGNIAGKNGSKVKHVGYVPEFVKKEIRDQVRAELKAEVVTDVKKDAKSEGWGIPAALPEWVAAINPSFDVRIRFADELYGKDNESSAGVGPYDWLAVNKNGRGLQSYSNSNPNEAYLNNQKDRLRLRERLRLGFEAKLADGLKAGIRLATSNINNPVSNDQTLGNTGQSYQLAIDRAFLQYDYVDNKGNDWFSLYGGRILNPFVSTDVVFDPDLSFEGAAGSFRYHFNQDDPKIRNYHAPSPTARFGVNQGQQTPDSVFMTLGVFPIQDVNFSTADKWLYAGQLGADWLVFDESRFNFAASYYQFTNINARYNSATGTGHEYDWTAPQFIQKGNSMVAITNANTFNNDPNASCTDQVGCLFGLASGFKIFNATAMFDYAGFGTTHVLLTADYAKNLGYNQQHILSQFANGVVNYSDGKPRTDAYQARIDVGHPEIRRFGNWNVSLAYRYVERDAVLDAFTDSVFHQGGTDAKGWVLGTQYGLAKNTWLNLRWFSTNAIDGPKYSVDTLNLDLNARF